MTDISEIWPGADVVPSGTYALVRGHWFYVDMQMFWTWPDVTLALVASPAQAAELGWVTERAAAPYLDRNRYRFPGSTLFDVPLDWVERNLKTETVCTIGGQPFNLGLVIDDHGQYVRWPVEQDATGYKAGVTYMGDDLDWIRSQGIFTSQDPRGLNDPWYGDVPLTDLHDIRTTIIELPLPIPGNPNT
ncbi:hypothetical protein [Leifsonia sp. Leaf264]|uniref:hypothetical protein n=1 Tax=Leifsonia sp. Leaf264 TaxID=1736314 RepID=UPI0006FD5CA6|nr:hypothetical protein [Leifsonia sp. Leaf264]KQO98273.1 hypothetical protein ASF30_09435 [Leifsonia sp. Leaf264]